MPGLAAELAPLAPELELSGSASWILTRVPRLRGNWLLTAGIFRVLPRRKRLAYLRLAGSSRAIEMSMDLSDPAQFSLAKNGNFDALALSILTNLLSDGDTFVDVGANWGYFTCAGSRLVGTSGLVVAFEPDVGAYAQLVQAVRRNLLSNVLTFQLAAYDSVGDRVYVGHPLFRQSTSSFVRLAPASRPANAVTATVDHVLSKVYASRVRTLKIDTEGAELPVLRGAIDTLGRWHPVLFVEVSEYSRRFGYRVQDLYVWMKSVGYSRAWLVTEGPPRPEIRPVHDGTAQGQIVFWHDADSTPDMML